MIVISALTRSQPIGETDPAAHEQAVRKVDWLALWRRAETTKTKERRK